MEEEFNDGDDDRFHEVTFHKWGGGRDLGPGDLEVEDDDDSTTYFIKR